MRGVGNSRNSSVVQTISNDLAMNNDKSRLMNYADYSDNGSQILEKQIILDDIVFSGLYTSNFESGL